MPIKPENRARYPANWAEIVAQVRKRSGDKCEGSPMHPNCRRPNGWLLNKRTGELADPNTEDTTPDDWGMAGDVAITIVLTTAHLDHMPENCDLANLRHWCQRCHLVYDAEHHAQTAYQTRRERANTPDMFV